jgi:hypothetical protein
MNDIAANHQRAAFRANVADRFGLLPNFFCSASAAPGLIERLWDFAQSAYLDSPLPFLFKERLFVHLSRFCPVRYCIVRHVGFLIGAGRPAGDATAPAETVGGKEINLGVKAAPQCGKSPRFCRCDRPFDHSENRAGVRSLVVVLRSEPA